jgi:predicted metal-dependent hydrolase
MTSNKQNCLLLILGLFVLYLLQRAIYNQEQFINYDIGDKSFLVLEKKSNFENAASILNIIDKKILSLIDHCNTKYSYIHKYNNNTKNQLLLNIKDRMKKTYKSKSLKENFPNKIGTDVSYNVNKGEDISLCLRNYDDPDKFHDINDITFVALHELAHSCNESYGHDTKFWKIFRIILENAVEIGIYQNNNYKKDNVNYCSMNITYNPIFDKTLDDENYFK